MHINILSGRVPGWGSCHLLGTSRSMSAQACGSGAGLLDCARCPWCCCGLDLDHPPEPVMKAWFPAWCYWEVVESFRGGAWCDVSGFLGCALEGGSGAPLPSLPHPVVRHMAFLPFSSSHALPPRCVAPHRPKGKGGNQSQIKTSKTVSTNKPFHKLMISSICYSNRTPINKYSKANISLSFALQVSFLTITAPNTPD